MNEETLFAAALGKSDPAERRAFLDAACGGDRRLRDRVERLLEADERGCRILDRGPGPAAVLAVGRLETPSPDGSLDTAPFQGGPRAAQVVGPPGYELSEPVGEGGMGVVYRARDTALARDVAVKVLRPRLAADGPVARRFLGEARVTAQLQHPGVPPVHQVGELPDGRPFLVMKLIQGRTLADLLADERADRGQLLAAFEQVCQAVAYAHSQGVVHRDLKPSNVMVGEFGEVQVMDWGLAKVLAETSGPGEPTAGGGAATAIDSDRRAGDATRAGDVLGTPAYMPPEQATGAVDQVDQRSDVFGLGGILCTILTGRPPYVGQDVASTHEQAAKGRLGPAFTRLDGCGADPDLVGLCRRCLAAGKADRPADAGEVARAVAGLRAAADERARRAERDREQVVVRAAEERKRRRVVVRSAVAAAAVLAAATGVSAWLAVRAADAERSTAEQLGRTQGAEAEARAEAANARSAEGKAREEEAKAVDRERKEKAARETADAVATFMREVFAQNSPFRQTAPDRVAIRQRTVKEAMDHAAKTIGGAFPGQPEIEAAVRDTIGRTYQDLGAYPEAEEQLTRALAIREQTHGPVHPATLTSVNNLAALHMVRGNYAAAGPLYRRALAGSEKAHGPDHHETLATVNNLAELLRLTKDYAAAEPLYRRALAGIEKAHGPDHRDTLTTVSNLGMLLLARGDPVAAEPLLRRALAGREKAHGPDHLDTLTSVNNLGMLLLAKEDYAAAEPLLRRALAGFEKAHSPDHPDTLSTVNNLALLLHARDDYAAAEVLYRRALAGREKALDPDHPDTLASLNRLVEVLRARRDYAAAEPLLRRALAETEKAHGPDDLVTLRVASKLAELYIATKQYGEAVPVLERAARGAAKRPEMAGTVAAFRSDLGVALLRTGKPAEAEPQLLAAYEGLAKRPKLTPAGQNWLRQAAAGLVEVYDATNQPAKAAEWRATLAKLPPEVAPPPRPAGR